MEQIYRITIRGRILESKDLRALLARAVEEKRNSDRAFRFITRAKDSEENLTFLALKPRGASWDVSSQVM